MLAQPGPVAFGIMAENTSQRDVKICLLGEQSVGKTSIANRFIHGKFGEKYVSTVGAAFSSKCLFYHDTEYRIALWDTAGEEKYHALASLTYNRASAAILVYDITSQTSYREVEYWMSELRMKGPEEILIFIVGNKTDLESEREVDKGSADHYADSHGAFHLQSSAKTGQGIADLFMNICAMLNVIGDVHTQFRHKDTVRVDTASEREENLSDRKRGCKCSHS